MSDKSLDEYTLVRIEDVIKSEKEMKYLIVWMKRNCNTFERSWHSLEEITDMGYTSVIQDFENIKSISSLKPIILAEEENQEEMKDDKGIKQDSAVQEHPCTMVESFVKTCCDLADRIANAAEAYLQNPSNMISESLLPPQWRT